MSLIGVAGVNTVIISAFLLFWGSGGTLLADPTEPDVVPKHTEIGRVGLATSNGADKPGSLSLKDRGSTFDQSPNADDLASVGVQPHLLSSATAEASTLRLPLTANEAGYGVETALGGLTFDQPVDLVSPPNDTNRLFIVEKTGSIAVVTNLSEPTRTVFLDIADRVYSEAETGMLSLAFHPGFNTNGYFYVSYTELVSGDFLHWKVSRFQVSPSDPNRALPDSEVPIIVQVDGDAFHEGGHLRFGPDGYLYISVGDGGGHYDLHQNGQRIDRSLFSGILRIDVDRKPTSLAAHPHPGGTANYAIPPDNPFVNWASFLGHALDLEHVRTEFFSIGLRNPWRFSIDPETGDIYCNDVGQARREEINILVPGGNYGWPYREGSFSVASNLILGRVPSPEETRTFYPPLAEYGQSSEDAAPGIVTGGYAISGGLLYRGKVHQKLNGAYLFSDFSAGPIGAIRYSSTETAVAFRQAKAEIAELEQALRSARTRLLPAQREWENAWKDHDAKWQMLKPVELLSEQGTGLRLLSDNSVLAVGPLRWSDTYTVVANVNNTKVTGVRLELLLDDSLDNRGPGRQSAGNVVISEFTLSSTDSEGSEPNVPKPVMLQNPLATFSQINWPVENSIDGTQETGWALSPFNGRPHAAVFEVDPPLPATRSSRRLRFQIQQNYGNYLTLGRFRLSITSSEEPVQLDSIPMSIAEIIRTPINQRTLEQEEVVSTFYATISPELKETRDRIESLRDLQRSLLAQNPPKINWICIQPGIASFGVHPQSGDILMASTSSGKILRLVTLNQGEDPVLPETLAETGAFSNLSPLTPSPSLIPYQINSPFWSDHAEKYRWFSFLGEPQKIGFSVNGNWSFPTGMVWIKHFELEMTNGIAESRRPIETRFIVKNEGGVYGVTYQWNEDGSNATLVPEAGATSRFIIAEQSTIRTQLWTYPSRSDCLRCHNAAAGYALGFSTPQLNCNTLIDGEIRNQISVWNDSNLFRESPGDINTLPRLAGINDTNASLELRVRSYFQANCAYCHRPGTGVQASWDGRFTTSLGAMGLIHRPSAKGSGETAELLIRPGSPQRSILLQRISNLGPEHMPPLATSVLNDEAVRLVQDWISDDLRIYETFEDWQIRYFGTTNATGAGAWDDPDHDGSFNVTEYLVDKNPLDRADAWKFSVFFNNDIALIHYPPVPSPAQVEWTTNLFGPDAWKPLPSPYNIPIPYIEDSLFLFVHPAPHSGELYYRLNIKKPAPLP